MSYNSFRGGTATYNVSGNIMSLIDENNFQNLTAFKNPYSADWNFYSLFFGANIISCENLILPATTLTSCCYANMFYGCKYLTTAPTLPAENLASNCYYQMFSGCSSLTYIKCLAKNISNAYATSNWVSGVASTGTFVKNPNLSSWTTGGDGIPEGWTVIDNS